jgi:hypothetical protein
MAFRHMARLDRIELRLATVRTVLGAVPREYRAWLSSLSDADLGSRIVEAAGESTAHLSAAESLDVYRRFRESGDTF